MKRQLKTLVVAVATVAMTTTSAVPVTACGGGGGGGGGGYYGGGGYSSFRQPSYSQPSYGSSSYGHSSYGAGSCPTSSYGQASYGQPSYAQPAYHSPTYAAPSRPSRVADGHSFAQPSRRTTSVPVQQSVAPQQAPIQQAPFATTRSHETQQTQVQSRRELPASQRGNAIQQTPTRVAQQPHRRQTSAQQVSQRTQQTPVQRTQSQSPTVQPTATQPAASQVAQTQQPLSPPQSVANESDTTTELTALQLLESLSEPEETNVADVTPSIPEFATAASATVADHVGDWNVTIGNQSVNLMLNDNGTFSWIASKNGNTTTLQGQYRLEDGRLTLVESKNLQQMAGSWSRDGDNFTFKLDGATTGGLLFARR